jgi:hypothetical protein
MGGITEDSCTDYIHGISCTFTMENVAVTKNIKARQSSELTQVSQLKK